MDQSTQPTETPTVVAAAPAAAVNPGRGLGIASLVLSLIGAGLIGLILGIVGLNKSKKANQKNGLALAGIIIGAINIVVGIIVTIVIVGGIVTLANKCTELGAGTHTLANGTTLTCGSTAQ